MYKPTKSMIVRTNVIPSITGRSFEKIAIYVNRPTPGQLNTISVVKAPAKDAVTANIAWVVIAGDAVLKTCLNGTLDSGIPLALAVRTKSSPIVLITRLLTT